jgi:putative ABC transport system substrate-binding protein
MLRKVLLVFSALVSLSVASIALAAEPRSPSRIVHLGVLTAASPRLLAQFGVLDPFFERLRELGYVEGSNLVVEYRLAEGKPERLPDLAADLVRMKVDVILAGGSAAAHAAKNATTKVPIVFTLVGDAVAEGLVTRLARPEGNVTGVSISGGAEIVGKRMQLLKEAVPSIERLGLLWNPGDPSHSVIMGDMPRLAKEAGVDLRTFEVRHPEDFEGMFASITHDRIEGLVVLEDAIIALRAKELAEFLAQSRVPAIYGATEFVEAGGLMSYQTSFASVNRQAAMYVDKILKGAKPSDLPVIEPTKFELVINQKAAKALGLLIPEELLLRADEVIR